VLVASAGGPPIGYAALLTRRGATSARLYSIAVSREATGRGVGSLLLEAVEEEARRRGCHRVHLEVRADNPGAISFYERSGYRRIGHRPGYYQDGATAHLFSRALSAAGASPSRSRRLSRAA
jgi:ribosomal protein S18 acetylase RimI-like enzyme